jgi:hypothetical protein
MIKECGVPNNKPQIGYLVGEGKQLAASYENCHKMIDLPSKPGDFP